MVSLEKFRNAFSQQWNADRQHNCEKLQRAYRKNTEKTAYMLGANKSSFSGTFFDRLAKNLGQEAIRERQQLDIVYYTTKAQNISHEKRIRPARLNVIIEHANEKEVEEEMWKLLMWRAPLKVLVFYDHLDIKKKQWPQDKIRELLEMHDQVNALWPEADETAYLFLVGRPPQCGDLPIWRHCDSSNKELRPLRWIRP